jgi:hypothetical protein
MIKYYEVQYGTVRVLRKFERITVADTVCNNEAKYLKIRGIKLPNYNFIKKNNFL